MRTPRLGPRNSIARARTTSQNSYPLRKWRRTSASPTRTHVKRMSCRVRPKRRLRTNASQSIALPSHGSPRLPLSQSHAPVRCACQPTAQNHAIGHRSPQNYFALLTRRIGRSTTQNRLRARPSRSRHSVRHRIRNHGYTSRGRRSRRDVPPRIRSRGRRSRRTRPVVRSCRCPSSLRRNVHHQTLRDSLRIHLGILHIPRHENCHRHEILHLRRGTHHLRSRLRRHENRRPPRLRGIRRLHRCVRRRAGQKLAQARTPAP